jgi:hypothetical protein
VAVWRYGRRDSAKKGTRWFKDARRVARSSQSIINDAISAEGCHPRGFFYTGFIKERLVE